MDKRDKEIKKLRESGWIYSRIGKEYNITAERVRQIILGKKLSASDRKEIIKHVKKEYKKRFHNEMKQKDLLEDIERLSKQNRKKTEVVKRGVLIKYLHNELELPFIKIGVLLHRDHTTISHSYFNSR